MGESHNITHYLQRLSLGDQDAEKAAFRLLYRPLRQIALREMRKERTDHTLQPTALVNEAYLKLAGQRTKEWQNRAHFLAVAAVVMRQVLVDYVDAGRPKNTVDVLPTNRSVKQFRQRPAFRWKFWISNAPWIA